MFFAPPVVKQAQKVSIADQHGVCQLLQVGILTLCISCKVVKIFMSFVMSRLQRDVFEQQAESAHLSAHSAASNLGTLQTDSFSSVLNACLGIFATSLKTICYLVTNCACQM